MAAAMRIEWFVIGVSGELVSGSERDQSAEERSTLASTKRCRGGCSWGVQPTPRRESTRLEHAVRARGQSTRSEHAVQSTRLEHAVRARG